MKKGLLITLGVIVLLVFITYRFFAGTYNTMVKLDNSTAEAWANVETQYQRRADLIPNLVNTVKGFAEQEKGVLIGVTEARSKASSIQIDASNLNAASMQQFQAAQGELTSALSRLLVTVERYPDIKSNQNFLELQAQLEGTENRISVERRRYNGVVTDYQNYIEDFPNLMLANMYGFEERALFAAQEGSENAPTVEF
jgi:LemA protein